jgi:hypothetical protein
MKGIRSLFRLGALAMVAVLLVVALTVPAAAAGQTCDEENMLDEVVILSVTPIESAFTWDKGDLLSYGDGDAGTYPTGQLEVKFNDINTAFNITHYDVIATPSDDPGVSDSLGIGEVVTSVNRPSDVGSVVTATLDLQPGTNYDIDVVANFYSVQISENQSNQDSLGATTFLSPPFLGGGVGADIMTVSPESPSERGVHYLVYKQNQELHTLRWLNPETFGPFDHKWKVPGSKDTAGADILCTDEDGDLVEDDCYKEAKGVVGITHYRVTVTDEDGTNQYNDTIEVHSGPVYEATFPMNDGTYTFAVDAGYLDGKRFYALSDKAQVEFDIPDDYRTYQQDRIVALALLDDIVGKVDGTEDDFDAFYDSDWDYDGLDENKIVVNAWDVYDEEGAAILPEPRAPVDDEAGFLAAVVEAAERAPYEATALEDTRQNALIVYLNNLYN